MMKKFCISVLVFFALFATSCSDFHVLKDISLGSDYETVRNVLAQNKIKYTDYEAGGFLAGSYDCRNAEEIADLIVEQSQVTMLGEMLYKDSFFFWHDFANLKFETFIYFYDDQCSNIELKWHLNNNPSERNGYLAAEKFMQYVCSLFPDCTFGPEEKDRTGHRKFVMQITDTVSITVRADEEVIYCDMEDSELQKPYKELHDQVDLLVKELRNNKK